MRGGKYGLFSWRRSTAWLFQGKKPNWNRYLVTTVASVKTMAVIQKRLLGRGMDSMAHRKTSTGSTSEAADAVTM